MGSPPTTPPRVMRGSTISADGAAGYVVKPLIADRTKFLRGDGTFQAISGGGDMLAANNLGDVASVATARTNLGLGSGDSPMFTALTLSGAGIRRRSSIVAIGDSITLAGAYQAQWLTHLGATSWFIRNEGVSGQNTTQIAARFAAAVTARDSVEAVVIQAGHNDLAQGVSAATIKANLQAMYSAAQAAGKVVIALTISPWKTGSGWSAGAQTKQDDVNTWINTIATDIDFVVDDYADLEDPGNADALNPTYSSDGLHMSSAGYVVRGNKINTVVGTLTPAYTADAHLSYGSTVTDNIYRAGAGYLATEARWTFHDTTDYSALTVAAMDIRGGLSVMKSAGIGGTLTVVGALTAASVSAASIAGLTTTDLTARGGSSGALLTLVQGANGGFTFAPQGTGILTVTNATPIVRLSCSTATVPHGIQWYQGSDFDAQIVHQSSNGHMTIDVGRGAAWGGRLNIKLDGTQRAVFLNSGNLLLTGGLGVGNSAAATTPGSVVKKVQLFDQSNSSLGYVAIYDAIS